MGPAGGPGLGLGPGGDQGRCVGAREAAGAGSLGAGRRDRRGEPRQESPGCLPLPREPCPGCRPPFAQGSERASPGLPAACSPPGARSRPALCCAGSWPPWWSGARGRGWPSREQVVAFCFLGVFFFKETSWAGPWSEAGSPRATALVRGVVVVSSLAVRRAEAIWQPLVFLRATPPPPAHFFSQVLELVGTIHRQELTHSKNGPSVPFTVPFWREGWEGFILKTT